MERNKEKLRKGGVIIKHTTNRLRGFEEKYRYFNLWGYYETMVYWV